MQVLKEHLQLWRALTAVDVKQGKPFPPAKQIIPYLTAMSVWVKGGVDVQGRPYRDAVRHLRQYFGGKQIEGLF